MATNARCDYCGADLGCRRNSAACRDYWQLDVGLHACDACLLANADDFGDMPAETRLVALRMRYVAGIDLKAIDSVIERARRVIVPEQVQRLTVARERVFTLHREGERVAAMAAAQALFNDANALNMIMKWRPILKTGRKVRKGAADGGAEIQKAAQSKHDDWQQRADAVWAKPQHAGKSASAVAQLIALPGENSNTIRRRIKKVVTVRGDDNA